MSHKNVRTYIPMVIKILIFGILAFFVQKSWSSIQILIMILVGPIISIVLESHYLKLIKHEIKITSNARKFDVFLIINGVISLIIASLDYLTAIKYTFILFQLLVISYFTLYYIGDEQRSYKGHVANIIILTMLMIMFCINLLNNPINILIYLGIMAGSCWIVFNGGRDLTKMIVLGRKKNE